LTTETLTELFKIIDWTFWSIIMKNEPTVPNFRKDTEFVKLVFFSLLERRIYKPDYGKRNMEMGYEAPKHL
jgi:hypothetical protein